MYSKYAAGIQYLAYRHGCAGRSGFHRAFLRGCWVRHAAEPEVGQDSIQQSGLVRDGVARLPADDRAVADVGQAF